MMIHRILLAVDGSPDALAASRLAVELAATLGAGLRVVHVSPDHELDRALERVTSRPAVGERRTQSAVAILERIAKMATVAGVDVSTERLAGDVGPTVLELARAWPADLIVLGRSTRPASGQPYVGSQTRHVLEFADAPVLVATAAGRGLDPAGRERHGRHGE